VLLYALGETAYVLHLPLLMDEFHGAAAVAGFERGLLYLDLAPHKTALGTTSAFPIPARQRHFGIIDDGQGRDDAGERCSIGSRVLVIARTYTREAVYVGLLVTVPMSTCLERSVSPGRHVDGLGWSGSCCWSTAVSVGPVQQRLSFFVFQKGIHYCVAAMAAFAGSLVFRAPVIEAGNQLSI
jgi:hypothetical protein